MKFELPELDFENTRFRLDPFMKCEDFSIASIHVVYKNELLCTLWRGGFISYVEEFENCLYHSQEEMFEVLNNDAMLFLNASFNEKIIEEWHNRMTPQIKLIGLVFVLLLWFDIAVFLQKRYREKERIPMSGKHRVLVVLTAIVLMLGFMLSYGAYYLLTNFGAVNISELLFYAQMPLEGTNTSAFATLFLVLAAIAAGCVIFAAAADAVARSCHWKKGYVPWVMTPGIVAGVCAVVTIVNHFHLISYWQFLHAKTTLYEEYYVDGRDVQLTFPEEKRNLIYIYLESMETTYASEAVGGAMTENYIPELSNLAMEHIDFSAEGCLNGAVTLNGATYTSSAIVAQTSGVPINSSFLGNGTINTWAYEETMLPGVWTIGDVLKEEGYKQVFMIGSDAVFGGRSAYMHSHGDYEVKDYYTAIEEGNIDEDYYVWWGYEDAKLISYAKEELLALAQKEEPFNFTMLTVDTHFTDGYLCEQCGSDYKEQYSNVIACSSRRIAEFVEWIKQQAFYKNTTIVIAGDHLTMDTAYIQRENVGDYDRKIYFTIINPAEGCKEAERERQYTTFDIYPTTLAAMGVAIEGNRLGLGVNLFSGESALCEQYSREYLNEELLKNSDLYKTKLLK